MVPTTFGNKNIWLRVTTILRCDAGKLVGGRPRAEIDASRTYSNLQSGASENRAAESWAIHITSFCRNCDNPVTKSSSGCRIGISFDGNHVPAYFPDLGAARK